jgi:exosortase/archaeosortase family protein
VPTDTACGRTAFKFTLRASLWSLAFFGMLRLSWMEVHAVLPFTQLQAALAVGLFGTPASPIDATLACSGADAVALCFGAIFGYPVQWRTRLVGAAAGGGVIVALNISRIGTLGRAASSPFLFNALHVYIWPAVLTLAIAGYVFAWMRVADRPVDSGGILRPCASAIPGLQPTTKFVLLTAVFLVVFAAASPLYLESAGVLALAGFIARAAAAALGIVGASAQAAGSVLWTARGGFLVTEECIATPLIPLYLAAICTYSSTVSRFIVGIVAALPLFTVLGIARLLVVALPDTIVASSPFMVHAFYQLLLAVVLVFLAARWRHTGGAMTGHAIVGLTVGVLFVQFLGALYTRLFTHFTGVPLDDPQGAVAFLPAFQVGFYLALWIAAGTAAGWRAFVVGLATLALTQVAGLLALHGLVAHGLTGHVRDVRGWAIAGPLLIVAAAVSIARPHR